MQLWTTLLAGAFGALGALAAQAFRAAVEARRERRSLQAGVAVAEIDERAKVSRYVWDELGKLRRRQDELEQALEESKERYFALLEQHSLLEAEHKTLKAEHAELQEKYEQVRLQLQAIRDSAP